MTDAPILYTPAVNPATGRFEDPRLMAGLVTAIANDPTLRAQLLAAAGAGGDGGGANTQPPVVYRKGLGTAADGWEDPPATLVPLEWRGRQTKPTAADGYIDGWDTYRRVDYDLPRPTLPTARP